SRRAAAEGAHRRADDLLQRRRRRRDRRRARHLRRQRARDPPPRGRAPAGLHGDRMSCLPLATLVDYWAHALEADAVERAEEHLFACDRCARRSETMRALADGVARVVRRRGGLFLSLTPSLVERLAQDGVRL